MPVEVIRIPPGALLHGGAKLVRYVAEARSLVDAGAVARIEARDDPAGGALYLYADDNGGYRIEPATLFAAEWAARIERILEQATEGADTTTAP